MPSFRAQSRNPPCPFRGRLPILLCHTYDAIPVCKKDRGLRSGWRCGNRVFQTYPLYATWNNPFPHTVISSAARNLSCTPSFLAPFAEGFPFSAISHGTLYRYAKRIPPLRSGWRYRNSDFQTYPLYATWNRPIPPRRHFERSEKSFLHSVASCFFRKRFPLFRYLT